MTEDVHCFLSTLGMPADHLGKCDCGHWCCHGVGASSKEDTKTSWKTDLAFLEMRATNNVAFTCKN